MRGEKMKNIVPFFIGAAFLFFGIMGLLAAFNVIRFSMDFIWPLFILIPGIAFETSFFAGGRKKRDAGILVPGGILIVIGLLFYANIFYGWNLMQFLWPVFILAPAFGLFQLYLFGSREKGILVPVFILGFIGCIFLLVNLSSIDLFQILFSILLVALGTFMLFKLFYKGKKEQ